MKQLFAVVIAFAMGASMTGCARISTQVVDKPRVDQELEKTSGNRGYLLGKAPAPGPRKATRQMFQTDIEMATKDEMNPWKKAKPAAPAAQKTQAAPAQRQAAAVPAPAPKTDWQEQASEPAPKVAVSVPASADPAVRTYVVKKNDTLEKVSAAVYGDPGKWRRIYEANKDTLKSPNKIYVGQKLAIPNLPAEQKKTRSAQEQQSYSK